VGVDLDVALGADDEVQESVLSELRQHVVEERDSGVDLHHPRAIDVELDEDRRLLRGATENGS